MFPFISEIHRTLRAGETEDGDVALRKVKNVAGLFGVLSETMFDFMKAKRSTYPGMCLSRQNFWAIESWKRALAGVYLVRFVFEMPAQKSWNKFSVDDLKFNSRLFDRLLAKEVELFAECAQLKALPREVDSDVEQASPVKRTRVPVSVSETESPVKRVFSIDSDTTDDDEDDDA